MSQTRPFGDVYMVRGIFRSRAAASGIYLDGGRVGVQEWPPGQVYCTTLASLLAGGSHHRRSFGMIFEPWLVAFVARIDDVGFPPEVFRQSRSNGVVAAIKSLSLL